MSESIFTKIINREIHAEIVWENENIIVLMDAFPVIDGQVLVIPKVQIDHFFDLDSEIYSELFNITKWVARVLKDTFNTQRTVMVIEGFEVPHVHVKLYPANTGNGQFPKESSEELKARIKENAEKIRSALQ